MIEHHLIDRLLIKKSLYNRTHLLPYLHIPKIRSLDLRVISPKDSIIWDWPKFPTKTAQFIKTGIR